MSLLNHLTALLQTSPSGTKDSSSEWAPPQNAQTKASTSAEPNAWDDESDPWSEGVLGEYGGQGTKVAPAPSGSPLAALLEFCSNHHDDDPLSSIAALLSSQSSDDEISTELVDIIGYDHLDLVRDLLDNRSSLVSDIHAYLLSNSSNRDRDEAGNTSGVADSRFLSNEHARDRIKKQLEANASRPLYTGTAAPQAEVLPHVYSSTQMAQGNLISQFGTKFMLPLGTQRLYHDEAEEVIIPPARAVPPKINERLIPLKELDPLVQKSFPPYETLNRIQSIVLPTAYTSNENMLICAPTGAGKTDVAMLSILRVIDQYRDPSSPRDHPVIRKNDFKIIYVAPMKALASEIVRKLSKRLQWLSIEVRELTGDMQLTRAEIAQTQIIVTTPEKWDVVTRKPTGEGEIASTLRLLIIDEVHLLNEERGAVIETIVARTLRQVESSQSMIRIVGLSATLPNYKDVAHFLSVSLYKGLFYFDSSFRPIPLEQHFLGIKGKPNTAQAKRNLDKVVFDKVADLVAEGHQVMVFVHARKETVKAAMNLQEAATAAGRLDEFSCDDHPEWGLFRRKIGESRNKEMKQLFENGFGIHHAGMLRSDRNMMERMFEARAIKVLCCTATLAWGVNLPAHAVVIKGTQVYDSSRGQFVDLSVLDVLQIFGRAGRPGLETRGEGYICTSEDKLDHYLEAVTSSVPIESQFLSGLVDALNAEISLGTVANIRDAVQWLGYTYLFVRMKMNPFFYGIARDTLIEDPQLGGKRNELITLGVQRLVEAKMISFDRMNGTLSCTDLGRIAARYYIRCSSIEIFNKEFSPKMSEADIFVLLSKSTEFEQIQVRETELLELEQLMHRAPCTIKAAEQSTARVKGDTEPDKPLIEREDKVNILLQGFISQEILEDFALVSDMAYVAQNAGRIVRALLEIALSKKWARTSTALIGLSKAIEKRMWPYENPLRQFPLKAETLYNMEQWADDYTPAELRSFDATALGALVHLNVRHGTAILNAAKQFPSLRIQSKLLPLASDVINIILDVSRSFEWNPKVHASSEAFWIWVEDEESKILQLSHTVLHSTTESTRLSFSISIPGGLPPPSLTVRSLSDRWIGAEEDTPISATTLVMPAPPPPHTPLLPLPFFRLAEARDPMLANVLDRKLHTLNSIQTQAHWAFTETRQHSLLCAPTGSGKSVMGQLALWSTVSKNKSAWILVVLPSRASPGQLISELKVASRMMGVRVDGAPLTEQSALKRRQGVIQVLSGQQLLDMLFKHQPGKAIPGLDLVICEDLEQLDFSYELAVSLLRLATQSQPTRFIGLSASLDTASDLAQWLSVDPIFVSNFRPQDRNQSLRTQHQTFAIPHSAALFKAMAKPAHLAIEEAPPESSVIVFVPSREHCRLIAMDLITQSTLQSESGRGYLPAGVSDDIIQDYCARLQDLSLIDLVSKGIGVFHPRINRADRILILEMYAEGLIRVLLVPREACWRLPVRATVVIVMGTQYAFYDDKGGAGRQIKDYSLTELAKMQGRAVQHNSTGYFHLFCHAEALDTYSSFLENGLPLESELLEEAERYRWSATLEVVGHDKQKLADLLSFTFLSQRVISNPTYYGCAPKDRNEVISNVVDRLLASPPPLATST